MSKFTSEHQLEHSLCFTKTHFWKTYCTESILGPRANNSLLLLVLHPIFHHLANNAMMDRQPLFFPLSMVGRQECNLMGRDAERANNVQMEFLSDITGQNTRAISSINVISNLILMVQLIVLKRQINLIEFFQPTR